MKTTILNAEDPHAMEQTVAALRAGSLVAFPTDTVYGVGGTAFEPLVIQGLYGVKGREAGKAIPILLGDAADLVKVAAEMTALAERLARRFWPGPLTLVVPRHPALPANISPRPTIGVRMPAHPLALELLRQAGPLATTSANLSGARDTRTAQEVYAQLQGRIPLILDGGRTPGGEPSTVVDCTGPELLILRPGPVSLEQLVDA